MQVLLRKSEEKQDVQCPICGQGFRIFWERTSVAEQDTMHAIIIGELKLQHHTDQTTSAHPSTAFNLPSWGGSPEFSAAALLGDHSGVRRIAPSSRGGSERR